VSRRLFKGRKMCWCWGCRDSYRESCFAILHIHEACDPAQRYSTRTPVDIEAAFKPYPGDQTSVPRPLLIPLVIIHGCLQGA